MKEQLQRLGCAHGWPFSQGRSRDGQSLIESGIVMVLLTFILFGVMQTARLYVAQDILDYSATAGARAQAVGFNYFMTYKVVKTAAIPNAGLMRTPDNPTTQFGSFWSDASAGQSWNMALRSSPRSPQLDVEQARIPLYLGSTWWGELPAILDYEEWDEVRLTNVNNSNETQVEVDVYQDFPLNLPMHRAFYADDEIHMGGRARMGNHADLYLE